MPEQMRDSEQYRTLAKRPEYGDNDLIDKDLNPIDLDKDTNNPGDCHEEAVDEIDRAAGVNDSDTDKD